MLTATGVKNLKAREKRYEVFDGYNRNGLSVEVMPSGSKFWRGRFRIDGKVYVFPGKKPMDAKTVQLRLVVDGDKVVAQYRPDAQGEFLTAFEGPLPKPDGDQVGV